MLGLAVAQDNVVAALDTNVLLAIWSCHDLLDSYDAAAMRSRRPLFDREFLARCEKARESLLCAIHWHRTQGVTLVLQGEATAMLMRRAPAVEPRVVTSRASAHAHYFTWFVKDYLLPEWTAGFENPTGADAAHLVAIADTPSDPSPRKNQADDELVDIARRHGVPVITYEGSGSLKSERDSRVRKTAKTRGVTVLTPGQYVSMASMDEEEETRIFLACFGAWAPIFIGYDESPRHAEEILREKAGLYDFLLHRRFRGRSLL